MNLRIQLIAGLLVAGSLTAFAQEAKPSPASARAASGKPNIIFFYFDDMGYGQPQRN